MESDPQNLDERRLWIGNLDTRMTEYQLLKIVQKYGAIDKFDMLFHKSGPQAGQPRGFAFVTYKNVDESLSALDKLNGKLIGNKHVVVRLAKNINYDELEKPKPKIDIPVLAAGGGGLTHDKRISKEIAIQAIEAKLKLLESNKDDFEINKIHSSEIPLIQKYQFNRNADGSSSFGTAGNSSGIGGVNHIPGTYNVNNSSSSSNSRLHYITKGRSNSGPYNKTQRHHYQHKHRR